MERTKELLHFIDGLRPEELAMLRERAGIPPGGLNPAGRQARACRLFKVAEGVKRLDHGQMALLAKSFDAWTRDSRDERTRQSRERVRLLFLILRYTGARLGEVLSIDEQKDFDFNRCLIFFKDGRNRREAVLPEFVAAEIQSLAETLAGTELAGKAFRLDQGFVRRKFHEQADRCGLPKTLLNPRALRNSRAIEMLRGGAPLKAVQAMLGHSSANQTSAFVTYKEEDLRHIIHSYIQNESKLLTSARNAFVGEVREVRTGTIMSEATLRTSSGKEVVSVITNESVENLGVIPGKTLAASIKAPFVILCAEDGLKSHGARNRYLGTITAVKMGEIVAEVTGELDDGTTMCALATVESVRNLELAKGGKVWFLCSAFSVILNAL